MRIKPVTNKNILPASTLLQAVKVLQEAVELVEAAAKTAHGEELCPGISQVVDMEAMDVIVAARTYLHMRGYDDVACDLLYKATELKNKDRGYYLGADGDDS